LGEIQQSELEIEQREIAMTIWRMCRHGQAAAGCPKCPPGVSAEAIREVNEQAAQESDS
jgi:hypothetical protein